VCRRSAVQQAGRETDPRGPASMKRRAALRDDLDDDEVAPPPARPLRVAPTPSTRDDAHGRLRTAEVHDTDTDCVWANTHTATRSVPLCARVREKPSCGALPASPGARARRRTLRITATCPPSLSCVRRSGVLTKPRRSQIKRARSLSLTVGAVRRQPITSGLRPALKRLHTESWVSPRLAPLPHPGRKPQVVLGCRAPQSRPYTHTGALSVESYTHASTRLAMALAASRGSEPSHTPLSPRLLVASSHILTPLSTTKASSHSLSLISCTFEPTLAPL
jgi:hypothetical protein